MHYTDDMKKKIATEYAAAKRGEKIAIRNKYNTGTSSICAWIIKFDVKRKSGGRKSSTKKPVSNGARGTKRGTQDDRVALVSLTLELLDNRTVNLEHAKAIVLALVK
jgi:hypothetical protein